MFERRSKDPYSPILMILMALAVVLIFVSMCNDLRKAAAPPPAATPQEQGG